METRKLIQSGPSSLVISLPTWWVKENLLEKGMSIDLEKVQDKLLLRTKSSTKKRPNTKRYFLKGKEEYVISEELAYCFRHNIGKIDVPLKRVKDVSPLLSQVPGSELRIYQNEASIYNYLDKEKIDPNPEISHCLKSAKDIFQKIMVVKAEENAEEIINHCKNIKRRLLITESVVNEWISDVQSRSSSEYTLSEIMHLKLYLQELPRLIDHEIQLTKKVMYYQMNGLGKIFSEIEKFFITNLKGNPKEIEKDIKSQIEIRNKINILTPQLIELKNKTEIIILDQLISLLHSLERLTGTRNSFFS